MALPRRERERLAREGEILSAAESFFVSKGFENTTMDEIAKAAEFTKRTVYQYFTSKENLFYAVILVGVKRLIALMEDAAAAGGTGYDKVAGMRAALYRFVQENPDIYRLMSYTQYIKSDPATVPNMQELTQYNNRLFLLFRQVIEQGKADGSIRADFNMPVGIFALFFITTGFMNRIAEAGEAYSTRNAFAVEELVQVGFTMMDRLIR